jgi:hypothetical protein
MTNLQLDAEILDEIAQVTHAEQANRLKHQLLFEAYRDISYAATILKICLNPPKGILPFTQDGPRPCSCGCPQGELLRVCGDLDHESFVGCPRCGRKVSVLKSYRYAAEKWNAETANI